MENPIASLFNFRGNSSRKVQMRLSSVCSPEGSLSRFGLKHQSTAAQSAVQNGVCGWNKTCCPKCALLDSGLRNTREPRSHCTERWSHNGSEGLNLRCYCVLPKTYCTSPHHYWPTAKPVMLRTAQHSPWRVQTVTSVPALIREENTPPIWVFSDKCKPLCRELGCKNRPHSWMSDRHTTLMEYVQTIWAETYTQWPTGGYFAGIWQRVVHSRLMTPLGMWTLTTYKSDQDVSQKGWEQTSGLQSPSAKLVL